MGKKLLFYTLLNIPIVLCAQWKFVKEIELPQKPSSYAKDAIGNLYIGYRDGTLVKYDQEGEELLNFSLSNLSPISLVEPQFQLKTFLFYFDNQVITILDRFNTVPKNYHIREYTSGIVSMACPAPDGTFWMVENNPTVLKRIDPLRLSTILEVQPTLGSEMRQMKVYQNFLIILDELGLHLFDQFGNEVFHISKDISSITIKNDQLLCLSETEILEINLVDGETSAVLEPPLQEIDTYLTNGETSFFFLENRLFIYKDEY